jgi:hypothetical protein
MFRQSFSPSSACWWVVLVLVLELGSLAHGQDRIGANDQSGQIPARKKLAESRADEKPDSVAEPAIDSKTTKKIEKPAEPKSTEVGFFGDTKKFTKFGGWGSFGSSMGQFGFARTTLIMMPSVQEELKLTDEQKKKLREWQEGLRKKGEEMGRAMREKNGDDPLKTTENVPITTRVVQFTSMMNQFSSFAKENEVGLAKILNAPQRKRLNQIALQMEGVSALLKPDIIEALALMEEEQEQIQQLLNQSRAQQMTTWIGSMMSMRPRRPSGANDQADVPADLDPKSSGEPKPSKSTPESEAKARTEREKAMRKNFETMRDRTDQIHNRTVKEIINVLSKAQRAKFELLLGPPFDPSKINEFGRPPRQEGARPDLNPKPDEKKSP